MPFHQLTDIQLDAFREVGNIGMGHAATALSQMIGQRVEVHVPKAMVVPISRVPVYLGGPENLMIGIALQILGEARGSILLLFPEQSACSLRNALLGLEDKTFCADEETVSTLKEVGNILASAYLTALGNLMQRVLIPSVPALAYDMTGAIVDTVLIDLGQSGDLALMIEAEFGGDLGRGRTIKGHFFMIPDPQTFETFLAAAGG